MHGNACALWSSTAGAAIISVVGIIFSIMMFWRSFKQRREDKTLEFSEIAADHQDNTITVAKAATMFKGAAAVDASIVQMLDCIVEKDQTREMTDSQYNLLNELRKVSPRARTCSSSTSN